MKKALLFVLFISLANVLFAQKYTLSSPNGQVRIQIEKNNQLQFSITNNGTVVIPEVDLNMVLNQKDLIQPDSKVKKAVKNSRNDQITPVVAIKNVAIEDHFNELTLDFKKDFKVVFRAYDDAVAYRFETSFKDSVIVNNEKSNITTPSGTGAWFSFSDRWMNGYEHMYDKGPVSILTSDKTTHLPLLLDLKGNTKVLITESDLRDYPGLYFTGNGNEELESIFPPRVKKEHFRPKGAGGWDRIIEPEEVYDYIAKTAGTRAYPWRIFSISTNDNQLLNNEIVYKLAAPDKLQKTDWIKPGQVAWDWWNHWNVTGVDFRAGVNTDTYKYYIDFAAENGIPYIMLDEGWYELGDVLKRVPDIDVKAIADYGKSKNVGILLWNVWKTLDNQMDQALDLFQSWGVKGIKVDFMNRDDQDVVNFYYRCAKAAADHHLLVDFHGAHKPAGIQRTYPNVVNFEGVLGLEQDKWSDDKATPEMAVTIPFIRMFAGPLDYTPGAMRNAQKADFRPINDNPMSLGTRCQQIAMYVLYDAPLQMLADNPTAYMKEKESLDFITKVPTTWDKTIPLKAEIGKYVSMAREKGNEYFVGAMTNWEARDLDIDLSFLPEGDWKMVLFRDGINADRNGVDYKKEEKIVSNQSKLNIHMAPGGGWAARIYR